jgi:hypothetical protein
VATPLVHDKHAAADQALFEPYARQVLSFVREADPNATMTIAPPIDPGIGLLYLHVRPDLADDPEYGEAVATCAADIHIHHGVALATLLRARR